MIKNRRINILGAVERVGNALLFTALIIVYFEKYDSKSGIGSLMATMLPYSFAFFVAWTLLIIVWILFGLPLGPGAGLYLPCLDPGFHQNRFSVNIYDQWTSRAPPKVLL